MTNVENVTVMFELNYTNVLSALTVLVQQPSIALGEYCE